MKKIVLLSFVMASLSQVCAAADVTLVPNGKEVNINGSTVICQGTPAKVDLHKVPDNVVVGMARSGKLGACTAYVYTPTQIHIYLKTTAGQTEVSVETSELNAAVVLRDYYDAGACE